MAARPSQGSAPGVRKLAPLLLSLGLASSLAAPAETLVLWRSAARAEARPGEGALRAVAEALGWLGTPYRYGGLSREGVDCSGFVLLAFAPSHGELVLPRRSEDWNLLGQAVAGEPRPGDVLLFGRGGQIDHVGIALSADAFIHAASEGPRTGVIISRLDEGYWKESYAGARRLEGEVDK